MATGVWSQLVGTLPAPAAVRAHLQRMRPWHLAQGLPAVAAAIACAVVLTPGRPADLTAAYRQAGADALETGADADATLFLTRSLTLADLPPATLFALARAHHRLGRAGAALALMRRLAPDGGGGHPPAHYWVAGQLRRAPATRATLRALHAHLRHTVRSDPDHWQARVEVARLYMAANQLREAEHQLAEATRRRPEVELQLAGLYRRWAEALRDTDPEKSDQHRLQATRHAAAVVGLLERRLADTPADVALRREAALALMLAGRHAQATKLLEAGLARTPDPGLRRDLAAAHLDWANAASQPLGAVELLLKGLKHHPGDERLITALIERGQGDSTPARRVRRALRERLTGGPADFPVLYALGTIALGAREYDVATRHLRGAHRLRPRNPQVANNLAWALLHAPKPDLERALALCDTALRLCRRSNEVQIRDTRGRILFRLRRWREALHDLTAALAATPGDAELRRMLGVVYGEMRMSWVTQQHQNQGDRSLAR